MWMWTFSMVGALRIIGIDTPKALQLSPNPFFLINSLLEKNKLEMNFFAHHLDHTYNFGTYECFSSQASLWNLSLL